MPKDGKRFRTTGGGQGGEACLAQVQLQQAEGERVIVNSKDGWHG